jgi:Cu(I)/Ag(I) efflux system membrane fusion protein
MRRVMVVLALAAGVTGAYALGRYQLHSSATPSGRQIVCYVDPMHPSYTSSKPGIAPDCGMPLVPVYADEVARGVAPTQRLPQGSVAIDGATYRLLGIQIVPVDKISLSTVANVAGRVMPEDTRLYDINSGVDGFIRETYEDAVGAHVKKNQKLAEYYSPDFLAVASGFLAASQNVPGSVGNDGSRTVPFPGTLSKQGVSSLQGYADRLRNLGMSDMQIRQIAESKQLPESIDIVSPTDGFILSRNVSAGTHFEHAMRFYEIADLSRVWVVAQVDEHQLTYLRPGTAAQIRVNATGQHFSARVADSLPQSQPDGSTVKLRLEADNPSLVLRPDMVVDIEIPIRMPPAVVVPADAVIDGGAHTRVYVERNEGVFEPRDVRTGWRVNDRIEIVQGLQPGERVVAEATFLVDSESRLRWPQSAMQPDHVMSETASSQPTTMNDARP